MNKAVLMSIRPHWCELIASGKKTIEVRKTRPKIETPFKVYIYCTSAKPYLVFGDVFDGHSFDSQYVTVSAYSREEADKIWGVMNGKVIGEFVCDKVYDADADSIGLFDRATKKRLPECCLNWEELCNYAKGILPLYGWHISDLTIYDEPKGLFEFVKPCATPHKCEECEKLVEFLGCAPPVIRAPQSWFYVEVIT